MKIGNLAAATGTQVETIRYYERAGLLPDPARSEGNFRIYDTTHLERLQFIRHCRGLDMSLDEVRALLQFKDDPGSDCGDVDALLDAHIEHVSQRIRELRALEQQLKALRGQCVATREAEHCGILSGLAEAAKSPHKPAAASSHHLHAVHSKTST